MLPNISALWFVDCADPAAELGLGAMLDPGRTTEFMAAAFDATDVTAIGTSDLAAAVDGTSNRIFAAHYGRVAVIAGASLHTVDPAELTTYLTELDAGRTWVLVSIDATDGTGCFARWEAGELTRAFAGTSTSIMIDVGLPQPFEGPFWAGEHPQPHTDREPLALPFHPADLADAANRAFIGFGFHEGAPRIDPALLPVTVYRIGPDDGRDQYIETSVPLTPQPAGDVAPETEDAAGPAVAVSVEHAVDVPVEPAVDVPAEPAVDVPAEQAVDVPAAPVEDDAVDQTAPIPVTAVAEPDEASAADRRPGPISRFFGFRGRL